MGRTRNYSKQDEWIQVYFSNGGRKRAACEATGVPYSTLKTWLKDPEFNERMLELRDVWADTLLAALFKRGVEKSDTAAFFLLKSMYPERYDDEVRRAKWLAENNVQSPDAATVNVFLAPDEAPEDVGEPVEIADGQEH